MKFSEALEKYLEARDSLNHPYCHVDRKVEMRKIMAECGERMDVLTSGLPLEAMSPMVALTNSGNMG